MNNLTLVTVENGPTFWAANDQADSIKVLSETRKGGFARVYGYTATTGRTVPTVYDATVTTRFSYAKLIARKASALASMTLDDVRHFCTAQKLAALDDVQLLEAFDARKASELASIETTQSGDRFDAHRAGHDRCYGIIGDGVKVNYVTEKDADGIMQPVIQDGFPIAASIMLSVLEVSRSIREAGEYKTVNSGVPVLIGNAIKAGLKAAGVRNMQMLSLKAGNFERLVIDTNVVLSEDVESLMA